MAVRFDSAMIGCSVLDMSYPTANSSLDPSKFFSLCACVFFILRRRGKNQSTVVSFAPLSRLKFKIDHYSLLKCVSRICTGSGCVRRF